MRPSAWTRREAAVVAGAASVAVIAALAAYFTDPRRPTAPAPGNGWWSFSDQGRYLRSTLAWAAGRLDPADHWYLPGYPLLAVPFTRLTHSNPFLLPDLALLAAMIGLAAALAGWLAPGWRFARMGGAAVALASVLPPAAMDIWVTPWTSTPEAALTLAALLATLHLTAAPWSWRMAFAAGFCTGAVAGFRPADAVVLAIVAGLAACVALLRARLAWRITGRTLGAASAGVALALAPTVAAYTAVNGWAMNGYLDLSAAIGFEWRLLPLRWVTIVLAPEPLFADGHGLIAAFPWLAFGLAGMAACLVSPPGRGQRAAHALLIGAAGAHTALYLCYRDLHPQALWRFYNYHYFKWELVLLALYALLLLKVLAEQRWAAALAGMAALAALLPWRAELTPEPGAPAAAAQSGGVLVLPPLALGVWDAVVVPAAGSFDAMYSGEHNLYVGAHEEKWYSSTADFKVTPRPGGLMIAPLRPLRPGPLTVRFGAGVSLIGRPPYVARQRIVYGVPCWLPLPLATCAVPEAPGPERHPGEAIPFDGGASAMLGSGWSGPEPAGRWTNGALATVHFELTPPAARTLQVAAHAFAPPGSAALTVGISVNGQDVGRWALADGADQVLRASLPPGILDPDGKLRISFAIANPRRPRDIVPGSTDARLLGLSVRSITLQP